MSQHAKDLIEALVVKATTPAAIVEVVTNIDGNGHTSFTPDVDAKAKGIIEKHFRAMAEELEKEGCTFSCSVSNSYGSVSFGR